MGNIVLLDDLTINKIAAGEVIERPASVIKEMIENSIDAGATNITVEIRNGGISYIKVTDNGKGIAQDDLEIAFERHATSKIRKADDLDEITTMGFRGEALASIAAIANVEMVSKTENQSAGYKIVVEAGDVLEKEETGCPKGTSITVRNLFFNTPVRYKFLKKDYTESGYIEDVITRIALVHPEIAIKLINTGKTVIQTNGNGDLKTVIYSIYGKNVADGIINVSYQYEDIKVEGAIGKPEIARSNRSNQLFFVNKRYIKDKVLSAATEQAYKGMIPIGKFAFVVLDIEMNPSKVDVNVHPAKLEVRFQEESKVFQAIYHAIKDSLLKGDLISAESSKEENKGEEKQVQNKPGLFSINKPNSVEIDKYIDQESKIKTNTGNNIEDIYLERQKKQNSEITKIKNTMSQIGESINTQNTISQIKGGPINTQDILEKLKKLQQGIKEEVEKNPNIKLNENYIKIANLENQKNNTFANTQNTENNNAVENNLKQNVQSNNILALNNEKETNKENKVEETNKAQENQKQNTTTNQEPINQNENTNGQEQTNQNENANIGQEQTNQNENANIGQEQTNQNENANIGQEQTNQNENANIDQEPKDQKASTNQSINEKLAKEGMKLLDTIEEEIPEENKKDLKLIKEKMKELENNTYTEPVDFDEMYRKLFKPNEKLEEKDEKNKQEEANKMELAYAGLENSSLFENIEEYKKPTYKFIGIVFKTYIIIEMNDEMYVIDQHAAHERIMYEKVKKNYYSEDSKDSQMLLLPDIITLTHKEMDIAKENMAMFEKAGFTLEEFGENTIKLVGVPTVCIDLNTKDLFLETLDEINTVARTAKQEKEEKFIATVACKAAVKAHMALTKEEVDSLMDKLLELPNPFTCPHGRPTAIKMSKYEIERKFARK